MCWSSLRPHRVQGSMPKDAFTDVKGSVFHQSQTCFLNKRESQQSQSQALGRKVHILLSATNVRERFTSAYSYSNSNSNSNLVVISMIAVGLQRCRHLSNLEDTGRCIDASMVFNRYLATLRRREAELNIVPLTCAGPVHLPPVPHSNGNGHQGP
jgi:hypothetical protein